VAITIKTSKLGQICWLHVKHEGQTKLITENFAFLGAGPALLVTIFMRHAQIVRFGEGIAGGTSVSMPVYAHILEAESGEMDVKE
jgi:hypothetical protein